MSSFDKDAVLVDNINRSRLFIYDESSADRILLSYLIEKAIKLRRIEKLSGAARYDAVAEYTQSSTALQLQYVNLLRTRLNYEKARSSKLHSYQEDAIKDCLEYAELFAKPMQASNPNAVNSVKIDSNSDKKSTDGDTKENELPVKKLALTSIGGENMMSEEETIEVLDARINETLKVWQRELNKYTTEVNEQLNLLKRRNRATREQIKQSQASSTKYSAWFPDMKSVSDEDMQQAVDIEEINVGSATHSSPAKGSVEGNNQLSPGRLASKSPSRSLEHGVNLGSKDVLDPKDPNLVIYSKNKHEFEEFKKHTSKHLNSFNAEVEAAMERISKTIQKHVNNRFVPCTTDPATGKFVPINADALTVFSDPAVSKLDEFSEEERGASLIKSSFSNARNSMQQKSRSHKGTTYPEYFTDKLWKLKWTEYDIHHQTLQSNKIFKELLSEVHDKFDCMGGNAVAIELKQLSRIKFLSLRRPPIHISGCIPDFLRPVSLITMWRSGQLASILNCCRRVSSTGNEVCWVHDILRRLEDNTAQPEALKTCFGILAIMSREETNKLMIARDGMEVILSAMTSHVDKADVQEAGCDLLWSLSFNNNVVKDLIAKHGGATVLVRALKRHCRSADFLKSACGALSNMCQSKLNQDGVASQGGLQPLVGSIHAHQSNNKLLPFIFDALASLIVSNEDNARMTSSLGIIPLIVASLNRHQHALEVVKSGCHALAILSDVKGQASKIAYAGGVASILPLLHAHPSYADLHRVAAVVLLRMLQESSHVSREITCHEGIRILLMSLEKGGAQQDTVAAVTHILYSVTNPSSPSASLIEAQLWLPSKDGTPPVSSEATNNGRMLLLGDKNAAGIVVQNAAAASNGTNAQTALSGLVTMLNQYSERKDVVRASCRLLNNLTGYAGVTGAVNNMRVMETIFQCVTRHHNETKDVAESASSLLKAINRRHEVKIEIRKQECLNGILVIMQAKMNDEEVICGCCDILTQLALACFRGEKKNVEITEYKVADGRLWEYVAIECVINAIDGCTLLEMTYAQGGSAPTTGDKGLAMSVSNKPVEGGKRFQWSKHTVRFISSVLLFLESLHSTGKYHSWPLLTDHAYASLAKLRDVVPTKHNDIVKRIECLLLLLNSNIKLSTDQELECEDDNAASASGTVLRSSRKSPGRLTGDTGASGGLAGSSGSSAASQKKGRNAATEGNSSYMRKSSSNTGSAFHHNNGNSCDNSGVSILSPGMVAHGSRNESPGPGSAPPSRVYRYDDEDNETGFVSQSSPDVARKLYPLHPVKYPVLSGGVSMLLDTWPNYAERLLPASGGSRIFAANTQGLSLDRMHVVYESGSAGGKGLSSKLGNVLPYSVPQAGIGDNFEHSLTFDSDFESGNLFRAVQRGDANYDLFLRPDLHTLGHTQWFYFSVSNTHPPALVKLAEQGVQVPPVRVRFNIVNLTKPDSLFNLGMRPVVYSCWDGLMNGVGWLRSGSDIAYYANPYVRNNNAGEGVGCYYTLSFTLEFHNPKDTTLIAYSYPYTYSDYRVHINRLNEKPGIAHIMRQYKLCNTVSGVDCNLLVITNFKDSNERIGPLTMGQINGTESDNITSSNRKTRNSPYTTTGSGISGGTMSGTYQKIPLKPALFFSARVHPGETPASWMMKGMLDFLTSNSIQAQLLRQSFVIFIVPMLNPDGVIYGNNRCGLAGVDLNRQWKLPHKAMHPTIYSFKMLMLAQGKLREAVSYVDLHGHSRKYNVFMYGCDQKKWTKQQVRAFPKFFSNHALGRKYVNFEDCSFHVKKGRESTARVVVAKELNIACSYTLEATFCGSSYGPLKFCHMNIGHLQEVGSALADALLHFCIANGNITKDSLPPQMIESLHNLQQQHEQMQQQQQQAFATANGASTITLKETPSSKQIHTREAVSQSAPDQVKEPTPTETKVESESKSTSWVSSQPSDSATGQARTGVSNSYANFENYNPHQTMTKKISKTSLSNTIDSMSMISMATASGERAAEVTSTHKNTNNISLFSSNSRPNVGVTDAADSAENTKARENPDSVECEEDVVDITVEAVIDDGDSGSSSDEESTNENNERDNGDSGRDDSGREDVELDADGDSVGIPAAVTQTKEVVVDVSSEKKKKKRVSNAAGNNTGSGGTPSKVNGGRRGVPKNIKRRSRSKGSGSLVVSANNANATSTDGTVAPTEDDNSGSDDECTGIEDSTSCRRSNSVNGAGSKRNSLDKVDRNEDEDEDYSNAAVDSCSDGETISVQRGVGSDTNTMSPVMIMNAPNQNNQNNTQSDKLLPTPPTASKTDKSFSGRVVGIAAEGSPVKYSAGDLLYSGSNRNQISRNISFNTGILQDNDSLSRTVEGYGGGNANPNGNTQGNAGILTLGIGLGITSPGKNISASGGRESGSINTSGSWTTENFAYPDDSNMDSPRLYQSTSMGRKSTHLQRNSNNIMATGINPNSSPTPVGNISQDVLMSSSAREAQRNSIAAGNSGKLFSSGNMAIYGVPNVT